MKIEIEVDNLKTFAKALNNATVAYGDIVASIVFGVSPQISSKKFSILTDLSEDELKDRYAELEHVYHQIHALELEENK